MPLSAALQAAWRDRRPLACVLHLELHDGPYWASDRLVVSETQGPIEARVTNWGKLAFRLSDSIDTPSLSVTLADFDLVDGRRRVGRLGRAGRRLEGVKATVYRLAEGVCPADWSVRFTGYVAGRGPGNARGEISLTLRVDDRWLNRKLGRKIGPDVWPGAATGEGGRDAVLGKWAHVRYGECDSTGLGSHGLHALLYIDTVGPPWRWLYGIGDLPVSNVFVDGKAVTEGWTRRVERRGGWTGTTVDWDDTWPGEDPADLDKIPVVTVDGGGLDPGAPLGAPTSPVAQLRHALEAFGRSTWDGAAGVEAQLTDETSWAALEAWCQARGVEAAGSIGGDTESQTLRDFLQANLRAWGWVAGWSRTGQLVVVPMDWARTPAARTAANWCVEGENVVEPLRTETGDEGARGPGVRLAYCEGADGADLLTVAAMDPARLDEQPDEISMPLGPQRVV